MSLGYNLARPDALTGGAFKRAAARLEVFGSIASVPLVALGGLGWGWWPFNVMATFLVATLCSDPGCPDRRAAAAGGLEAV